MKCWGNRMSLNTISFFNTSCVINTILNILSCGEQGAFNFGVLYCPFGM